MRGQANESLRQRFALAYGVPSDRVCNSKYEPTSMNDLMRSVKHLTQVLIVGVYCVDQSRKFADSDGVTGNLIARKYRGVHIS